MPFFGPPPSAIFASLTFNGFFAMKINCLQQFIFLAKKPLNVNDAKIASYYSSFKIQYVRCNATRKVLSVITCVAMASWSNGWDFPFSCQFYWVCTHLGSSIH